MIPPAWKNIFSVSYQIKCALAQFSRSVVSDSLRLHGHSRFPCPLLSPRACSNSCPSSWWCYPTISSSIVPFSSCLQSFPLSGSFPVSQRLTSGGQSIGASASVLPVNIQGWFPLGLSGLNSLQSKGLSRVFFSTTAGKHQFFCTQLALWSDSRDLFLHFVDVMWPMFLSGL